MDPLELVCNFVNTADLEEGRDDLPDARSLVRWLSDQGLLDVPARAGPGDVDHARELREALRELLRANNGVDVDREAASATLDEEARRSGVAVRFVDGTMQFVATRGQARGALAFVLAAVGTAMADGSWPRLKACRSDACRWAFVDRSRNRSRQWCSMEVCGNREKARAFRSRNA